MTTTIDTLIARNGDFAAHRFQGGLSLLPSLKAIIVGCADPRVDPAQVLGLDLGEAVIIRNIGGRITPATLQTLALLGLIPQLEGVAISAGFHLIVLHHTDCGITRLVGFPDLLAQHLGVARDDLAAQAVTDPYTALKVDVERCRPTRTCVATSSSPDSSMTSQPGGSTSSSRQRPAASGAVTEATTQAAWHTIPSWYLVAKQDHAIAPDLERYMAARAHAHTVEADGSHSIMVSHPGIVAHLIETAAWGTR